MAQVAAADPFRLCRITPTIPDQGGLGEIFEAFQENYTDHLSQQQLIPWKSELQRSMDGESRPDLISQRITQGVAKLAHEIAIDALTGQTLRNPVLDGDWAYERTTHADCYVLFEGRSPLDGRAMAEDPPPHRFVAKVLAWARGVQKESHEETCEVVLAPSAALRRNIYRQMAWYAVQRRKLQMIPARMEQGFKAALAVVDRTLARADEKNAVILANAERNQAAHEEEMRNHLAGIQQLYQARISGLEDRMAASEQLHLKEITSLREQMAAHDQTELAVLGTIQTEIARKEEAQRAARQAMADQVTTIEAARRSEVDRLHNAHAASEARSQGKINQLETTQTKLQTSITQFESHASNLQRQLTAAHARNAENEAQLVRQQNELFQTRLELDAVRDDIDDQPFFKIGPLKFF